MTRVVVYEKTFQRVQDRLLLLADVDWILFEDSETLRLDGRRIDPQDARPDAAWFALDLYRAPVRAAFNDFLLRQPTLRWVQLSSAGIDDPQYAMLFARGVQLTKHHGHAVGSAEYVLAGVLDHFQHGPERRRLRAEHVWRPVFYREVADSRWLMLGFGAIGQAVAARARAFGARITAIRRNPAPHPLADRTAQLGEVLALLPQTDVVVLCVPLNKVTQNLVDARFLAAMAERSVLVNVGRGGLVDEAALLAALDAGRPEHAILDVFQTEPLPKQSPFWSHPRVAMTTHGASVTERLYPRADATFFENLARFRAGSDLLNRASAEDFRGIAE